MDDQRDDFKRFTDFFTIIYSIIYSSWFGFADVYDKYQRSPLQLAYLQLLQLIQSVKLVQDIAPWYFIDQCLPSG